MMLFVLLQISTSRGKARLMNSKCSIFTVQNGRGLVTTVASTCGYVTMNTPSIIGVKVRTSGINCCLTVGTDDF
ncbi:hypothetical protein HOLleu_05294 [Holothuria leucospilota]|uniref:Uncharacterized protein n=1 Tax=Holothuria leucospilota TaxID=206669 RepID=A0A9Q1CJV2_HOLLE|nr:hypothetical protein HOLleu_05294 [Holothuria leucospilota]